jgi:tryptophan-rich hypothetical protein
MFELTHFLLQFSDKKRLPKMHSVSPKINLKINTKKLINSKWTAVSPVNKEKHFIVTKVILPDLPNQVIEDVMLEAVHSQRSQIIAWQQLNDATIWKQGWL